MTVKLLTQHHFEFLNLKGGYTDLSESTFVKIPHCWKSHDTAHMLLVLKKNRLNKTILLSNKTNGLKIDG